MDESSQDSWQDVSAAIDLAPDVSDDKRSSVTSDNSIQSNVTSNVTADFDGYDSPSKTTSRDTPAPGEMRPLRLAKRSLHQSSSITPNEEFVCRPIRLGSKNRSNEGPINDSRRHSFKAEDKHRSFNSFTIPPNDPAEDHEPGMVATPLSSKRNSISHETPTKRYSSSSIHGSTPSDTLSPLNGLHVNGNRRSIQVKNLPIIHAPKVPPPITSSSDDMIFALCLVDFHHARGPEIQWWKSNYHPILQDDHTLFKNLPFQALPDGSHLFEETFSNFNLVYDFENGISLDELADFENYDKNPNNLKTLFGCSCVHQVKTSDLSAEERERHKDITRSIVQKSIVVITRKQPIFTKIKEKLSIITKSYFQQDDFDNTEILENLFDNLNDSFKLIDREESDHNGPFTDNEYDPETLKVNLRSLNELEAKILLEKMKNEKEEEFFVNLNIKDVLLNFKFNLLIILKALLLEKKVLIFSNNNLEVLTLFQNSLIALMPNLMKNLDYSGCPLSDYNEVHSTLMKPNSLNTNNRQSMLRFFGLPLQIFNTKNNFWNPYLPLQQLDELKVDSFMAGCSNLLFVNQLTNYKIDLLVNLDSNDLLFPMGKPNDLNLSSNDKKFINNLLNDIKKDDETFIGNDDYIRYKFEDYLSSLVSTSRFNQYVNTFKLAPPGFDTVKSSELGDVNLFNEAFYNSWKQTKNYYIWDKMCDEFIFNFQEPKHIGVDLEDNHPYKITSLINNWTKKRAQPSPSGHHTASQAQKYIPGEDFTMVDSDTSAHGGSPVYQSKDEGKRVASWSWGFKKK